MEIPDPILEVLNAITFAGGKPLLVGGSVRDFFLAGLEPKDYDIEVYNMGAALLSAILEAHGRVDAVGMQFGVFKVHLPDGLELDFSLPRTENKIGAGHRGFMASFPDLTPKEAAARRDFTWNALAYDPFREELLDFYGGRSDWKLGVIRATSSHFSEDPLRVLRAMQFAGRFSSPARKFVLDIRTAEMCANLYLEYNALTKERVWEEWKKWAEKSRVPSAGLQVLVDSGWVRRHYSLVGLIGVPQDPEFHPEGGVWRHTCLAVDEAARIATLDGLVGEDRIVLVFAALMHDTGKISTTEFKSGHIVSPGHEEESVDYIRQFAEQINMPTAIRVRVERLCEQHMRHVSAEHSPADRIARRLANDLHPETIEMWARLVEVDENARPPLPRGLPAKVVEILRAAHKQKVADSRPEPILKGQHLVDLGMTPGPIFKKILNAAYDLQLDGEIISDEQAVDWVRKNWM